MPAPLRPPMSRAAAWTREQLAAVGAEHRPGRARQRPQHRQPPAASRSPRRSRSTRRCSSSTSRPNRSRRVESERLFENIRAIRDSGTAVVYISHRLPEVKRIADRITVLRDGETRGTFDAQRHLRGRDPAADHRPRGRPGLPRQARRRRAGAPLLEVAALSGARLPRRLARRRARARSSGSPASRATASARSCARSPGSTPARGQRALSRPALRLGRPSRMRSAGRHPPPRRPPSRGA